MEENSTYNAGGGFLFNPLMDFWGMVGTWTPQPSKRNSSYQLFISLTPLLHQVI